MEWVRRTYDDRRYLNGARHAVLMQSIATGAVTTRCGRYLLAATPAKAANRLVPANDNQIRSDVRTCGPCLAAIKRGGRHGTTPGA